MKRTYFIFWVILFACSDDEPVDNQELLDVKASLIEANINAKKVEARQIEAFLDENNMVAEKTGTGLRYFIYHSGNGNKAVNGKVAEIVYTLSLLDGTLCYSSKGPEKFIIGKDQKERGLHEAMLYLREGDKAKIILPSHLAHGLTGDMQKIPMRSTVIYDLELVSLH